MNLNTMDKREKRQDRNWSNANSCMKIKKIKCLAFTDSLLLSKQEKGPNQIPKIQKLILLFNFSLKPLFRYNRWLILCTWSHTASLITYKDHRNGKVAFSCWFTGHAEVMFPLKLQGRRTSKPLPTSSILIGSTTVNHLNVTVQQKHSNT